MYAWVFKDAQRLATPIKYNHPKGAVIWVTLPKDVEVLSFDERTLQTCNTRHSRRKYELSNVGRTVFEKPGRGIRHGSTLVELCSKNPAGEFDTDRL